MVTMTEKDYKVLDEKLYNPQKSVKCPRCGNEIIYEKRGNSIAVECKTKDCIYGGIRGI
jgi:ribosomal protein S27AE